MGITAKSTSWVRWPVLVLACFMLIGSYYSSEMPAALKKQLDDYFGNPSDFETLFSLLYSLYSIPNIFLPFFGGYFTDRLGVRLCLLIFTSLIALGQIFVAFGISIKSWGVVFLGRVIFGFGGECLIVANSALLADWFRGTELAFAFGVNLSIARLGSVSTNLISPRLAEDISLVFACWFGVILCAMSVLCVVVTIPIDRHFDELKKLQSADVLLAESDAMTLKSDDAIVAINSEDALEHQQKTDAIPQDTVGKPQFRDVLRFPFIFWVLCVSCIAVYGVTNPFNIVSATLLLERDYFVTPPSGCVLSDPYQCQSSINLPVGCPTSKLYQPPLPMGSETHMLVTPCGNYSYEITHSTVDCSDSCWSDGCTVEYCNRMSDAEKQVGLMMSIPYIISGTVAPFLGILVDNYGMRAIIITLSPVFILIVHTLLGYSNVSPVGPLVGEGLAYTGFAAVFWPSVPLVVEERFTGLAFGVVTSMLNLACAVIPLVVAQVFLLSNHLYIPNVEVVFMILGIIGIITGIYMNYYDYYYCDSILNRGLTQPTEVDLLLANPAANDDDDVVASKALLGVVADASDHSQGCIEQGLLQGNNIYSSAPPVSELHNSRTKRENSSEFSVNRRSNSRTRSQGEEHAGLIDRGARRSRGSFTAYEEVLYGGAFDHLHPAPKNL